MSVDLAAVTDGGERGLRAEDQFGNREREEGTIHALQPQHFDARVLALSVVEGMRVGFGFLRETHVDDEPHTEIAQFVVIAHRGRGADEEVVGDVGEVHAGNSNTGTSHRIVG